MSELIVRPGDVLVIPIMRDSRPPDRKETEYIRERVSADMPGVKVIVAWNMGGNAFVYRREVPHE